MKQKKWVLQSQINVVYQTKNILDFKFLQIRNTRVKTSSIRKKSTVNDVISDNLHMLIFTTIPRVGGVPSHPH